MEKVFILFWMIVSITFLIKLLLHIVMELTSESGVPKYKNPPNPPKKRKAVGIVHGRRLYRDGN